MCSLVASVDTIPRAKTSESPPAASGPDSRRRESGNRSMVSSPTMPAPSDEREPGDEGIATPFVGAAIIGRVPGARSHRKIGGGGVAGQINVVRCQDQRSGTSLAIPPRSVEERRISCVDQTRPRTGPPALQGL